MLAKKNRLKKKKDFERVFKKGKSFKEGFLILKITGNNLKTSRFGIAVSQKVSKKAVQRNKVKRRLGELIKAEVKKIKKGVDAILIASPGLENKDFWEMKEMVNNLFKKSKIIKNGPNNYKNY